MRALLKALGLILSLTGTTSADELRLKFRVGANIGTVTGFPANKAEGYPLALILRVGVGITLGGRWGWGMDLGMKTPFSTFNPAPQITVGPAVKLTDRVSLALVILARYTPDYGKGDSWLLAATIGPAYAVTPWLSLGLGVGGGAAFAAGKPPAPEVDVVWSQTFSF